MKTNLLEVIENQVTDLEEKEKTKLKIDVLQRLIRKLDKDEHNEIEEDLKHLIQQIPNRPVDHVPRKAFLKALINVQKKVTKSFGYVERGSVKSGLIGVWAAFGIAVGAGVGSQFGGPGEGAALGVILCLIIGVSIGIVRERKAENEGLSY